jgi:hypothetical protein
MMCCTLTVATGDKCTMILQNVGEYSIKDKLSHSRRAYTFSYSIPIYRDCLDYNKSSLCARMYGLFSNFTQDSKKQEK